MRKVFFIICCVLFSFSSVHAKSPDTGDAAPNFSLKSIDGKQVSLDSLKGKVVLMGMFHICVPCKNQALEFEKVRQALPSDNLKVFGINTAGDSKEAVLEYLGGFPSALSFPYYLDPNMSVHKSYIQRDMPTVLIIGPDGKILARTPSVSAEQLIPYLKKLL